MSTACRIAAATVLTLTAHACKRAGESEEEAGGLRVAAFSPQGETSTQPIEVVFSEPMIGEAQVGRRLSGLPPVIFSPEIPGRFEWRAVEHLVFVPEEPLRQSTRYTATVRDDLLGRDVGGPKEYRFHTPLFTLESTEPYFEGPQPVSVNLLFTHPVDTDAAAVAVRFETPAGDRVDTTLETKSADRVLSFRLGTLPAGLPANEVVLKVDGSLGPLGGGDPIGKEIVRKIALVRQANLTVQSVQPAESDGELGVWIHFSSDVDADRLKAVLTVDPPVELRLSRGYHAVHAGGGFQPSTAYTIKIAKSLAAEDGTTTLAEDYVQRLLIPDFEPSVRFESAGTYLLRQGHQTFSVRTVNVDKLQVTVERVPENNLAHVVPRWAGGEWYWRDDLGSLGRTLFSGTADVASQKNVPVTTHVPFDDVDEGEREGVYRLRIGDVERGWVYAEKWLLATDLGLTVKVSPAEARARVVSLATRRPAGGVQVDFISRTNQLVGRAWTDGKGEAVQRLSAGDAEDPLSVVTARRSGDFSFLALAGTAIPTADFDVGGEGDTSSPYEAFVYGDRDIYRPGETAQVVVLVRDRTLRTPPVFPYEVEVRNPLWRVFAKMRGTTADDGAKSFAIDLPRDALTGTYVVRALSSADGAEIGRTELKVEEFMPDRIKVEVKPRAASAEIGESVELDVESAYLFGPPSAGLNLEPRCRFREVSIESQEYRSFPIGAWDVEERSPLDTWIPLDTTALDAAGKTSVSCLAPSGETPIQPVRATLFATVSEPGGRAVTGSGSTLLHAHAHYVGVRRNSNDRYAAANADAGLEVLAVDREGRTKPGVEVSATFHAIEWKSILKLVDGRYRYVSERTVKKIGEAKVKSEAKPAALPFTPPSHGAYRVDVEAGSKSSLTFWVSGEGFAAWEMSQPDRVSMTLDRADYATGESAEVMIRAPFSGRLYLTVERDRVLWSQDVDLEGNTGTVRLPVTDEMLPNAYVVAQLVRSPRSVEKLAPARAFGVVPLQVRSERHKLAIELKAPEEIRPKSKLEVLLKVDGARRSSRVTVAAVDEGILRITGFQTPDPFAFFTRKRRLGIESHDMFDLLLPEVDGKATSIVRGSGGDEAISSRHLNPIAVRRVKPVALWSGIVETSREGWAKAAFDVPEFNGTLRLMAVAFEGERFGSTSSPVRVRDPIVVNPTLPRFVGPLDAVIVPVEVFNGTKKNEKLDVGLDVEGKIALIGEKVQQLSLGPEERGSVEFRLKADEVSGRAAVTVWAKAAGSGEESRSVTELAIRPESTRVTEGASFAVRYNEPAKWKVPGGFLSGTVKVRITVGALPASRFGAALQYLLQYPYGCVEQTTSKAFPLLYQRDMPDVESWVNGGITRLASMMTRGGALSFWPGGEEGYPWTTVYGAHFLVEAKKAGYQIDDDVLQRLLSHLERLARGAALPEYRGERPDARSEAYALYVLALAGRALAGETQHAAGQPDVVKDAEARTLIDGALLLAGDRSRAGADLPLAPSGPRQGFHSQTRADALMLSVLADVQPTHRSVPLLVERLVEQTRNGGRWSNTQENAFALMALGKIGQRLGGGEFWGTIRAGGETLEKFSFNRPLRAEVSGDEWAGKEIEIALTGAGTAFAGIEVEGIKAGALEPKSEGLEVRRTFLNRDGAALDPSGVRQGDLVTVKIALKPAGAARIDQVAIVDLLPAGLEIENPRLSDEAIPGWMKDRHSPDYLDVRDDRIILFTSVDAGAEKAFYYTARAVTQGDFVLPHVHAEAMYDPATQSYNGGGRTTVGPPR